MNDDEKIEWKKCKNCGFLQNKSHVRCLHCKNKEFSIIQATGNCKLLTYTILNEPPAEFRNQGSYALGVVEFENRIKALGQLASSENLQTGIELKPVYRKICENLDGKEVYTYIFEPI
ncbi:MAG: Zn-ribbon domain-containing OB-fold protein [Promethearchaeota archaeon]